MKKKIFIDFDGVLNDYSGWKDGEIFKPKDGALCFIKEISLNYEIWIFTTREKGKVWKWLKKYHFNKYQRTCIYLH